MSSISKRPSAKRPESSPRNRRPINQFLDNPTSFSVVDHPQRARSTPAAVSLLGPCRLTYELINNQPPAQKRRLASATVAMLLSSGFFTGGSTAFAEDSQRLYRSAYYLGRGDTGLAIADDAEAIMYNPAGIAQGKGVYKRVILASPTLEFSDDARDLAKELKSDNSDIPSILKKRVGKNEHVGAYNLSGIVLRRAALGVFNGETTDILIHKSPEAGGLEGIKARAVTSNGVVFALAQDYLNQRLFIGGNIKYMHRGEANLDATITDADKLKNMKSSDLYGTGTGTSADLGAMWKLPGRMETSFGATVNNVGGTVFTPSSAAAPAPTPLKQMVNLGMAIQPGTKSSRFRILMEYWDATNALDDNTLKKTHFGAELSVRDIVGFTGGMAQGWTSGGMYIDLYVLRLDGGMYIQEMSDRVGIRPDKRIFLRVTAGF
jgi:hypothetical protein